jgi:hypothetical protein
MSYWKFGKGVKLLEKYSGGHSGKKKKKKKTVASIPKIS